MRVRRDIFELLCELTLELHAEIYVKFSVKTTLFPAVSRSLIFETLRVEWWY